jgi:superoxide dismutase, Cu-Zn family
MRSRTLPIVAAAALGTLGAFVLSHYTATDASGQAAAPAAQPRTAPTTPAATTAEVTKAIAVVQPLGDSKVSGKVVFTKAAGGVEIAAELSGLTPGEHGFHVHEFGDCSMPDGTCAGGHFNPDGKPHGKPDAAERHVGDFGNITAGADGKATYKRVDKMVSFSGPHSIIGRSVIIHANPDDFSQPTGNAGGRVGCGVIGIADPKMTH